MLSAQVSIVMGSDSDLEIMKDAQKTLSDFGIVSEIQVLSAHRSPELVAEYAKGLVNKGIKIVIAGAGGAAHLAGVIASHTILPVIGVPIDATALKGMDALLATVQMPSGVPVATVAIGKTGAANAGILAAQILAISSKEIEAKLVEHKKKLTNSVIEKNKRLQGKV